MSSFLKGLDYSVVQQCMHCGLCLPTCPTYDATKLERNSPRGRISLMRAIADEQLAITREFGEEMYFCLGCLACMSACPAGVNYAELFERARADIESVGALNTPLRKLIRAFAVKWLFMDLERLKLVGRVIYLYQKLGFQRLLRQSGVLRLLPNRLQELESITPDIQPEFSDTLIPALSRPAGPVRFRVAMLAGCAQDLIFSDINRDTVQVLVENGCEVVTPPQQDCCGSLHAHNGEWALAQTLARRQLDQFHPWRFDAIITNAGGCGSHLKHYSKLLENDVRYSAAAHEWDTKVNDINEFLAKIDFRPPRASLPSRIVTYHESCHLAHGQKITGPPRRLLEVIPNLRVVELPESAWCCGSAGIYNLVQPAMAGQLLERKLKHIRSTGAEIVATANPGCLLQLINGARQQGWTLRVTHPVSLLAEAYRAEK